MNGTSVASYETRIIPSDRQDYAYSVLIDKSAGQDRSISDNILDVMGLTAGSLIPTPDVNSSAQYLLILGYDYQPCFSPRKWDSNMIFWFDSTKIYFSHIVSGRKV